MSIVPNFDYLLVMPSGNIIGFHDEETAKAYINNYYYFRTRNNDVWWLSRMEGLPKCIRCNEDLTEDFDDIANVLCYKIGVEEGECKLYNTRDIIEKIQEEVIFFDEREEVISKLLSNHIDLNIFDYAIDNIFTNTESIDIMEPYGDPITGQ